MGREERETVTRRPSFPGDPGDVPPGHRRIAPVRRLILLPLLAAALAAVAGCATAPTHRAHPDWPDRKGGIRKVGLAPPSIAMSEEQALFGLNRLVPRPAWSSTAVEVVSGVFADLMAADGMTLVPVGANDAGTREFLDLYNAVDFSIGRHAREKRSEEFPPREPFPEKLRVFDWSLGPAGEVMERHGVDAFWIVRGYNLVPTTGARIKEAVEFFLGVLSAAGGGTGPNLNYRRIELRVALVDRTGSVLYYGVADERAGFPTGERPRDPDSASDAPGSGPTGEEISPTVDLRDPCVAGHYLRAALSGYRERGKP